MADQNDLIWTVNVLIDDKLMPAQIGGAARFVVLRRSDVSGPKLAPWSRLPVHGLGGAALDVVITDATAAGRETARLLLAGVPSPVTLRELIWFRVREEVARYNAEPAPRFNGLVRPVDAEATLNGYTLARPRKLDWEKQAAVAIDAFDHNGFFVFVGDRQVDDLDESLTLAETDVVSFVRLVPLVGG